jgi:hypothetical protein
VCEGVCEGVCKGGDVLLVCVLCVHVPCSTAASPDMKPPSEEEYSVGCVVAVRSTITSPQSVWLREPRKREVRRRASLKNWVEHKAEELFSAFLVCVSGFGCSCTHLSLPATHTNIYRHPTSTPIDHTVLVCYLCGHPNPATAPLHHHHLSLCLIITELVAMRKRKERESHTNHAFI